MAHIATVYTIAHVARMLGEDEDWLADVAIELFPEDGCLHIVGTDEHGCTGFTADGIENLKQLIAEMRANPDAPAA